MTRRLGLRRGPVGDVRLLRHARRLERRASARELERLFGVERADELLVRYHELEPEIQASKPGTSYREVLTIALEQLAAETGLTLPGGRGERTRALAAGLARLRRRAAGADGGARPRLAARDPLEHRPRPDRRVDGRARRPVRARDRRRRDRLVQARRSGTGRSSTRRPAPIGAGHVHVAQSLFHDIAPANELGIPSIWINRLGEPDDPRPTRDADRRRAISPTRSTRSSAG